MSSDLYEKIKRLYNCKLDWVLKSYGHKVVFYDKRETTSNVEDSLLIFFQYTRENKKFLDEIYDSLISNGIAYYADGDDSFSYYYKPFQLKDFYIKIGDSINRKQYIHIVKKERLDKHNFELLSRLILNYKRKIYEYEEALKNWGKPEPPKKKLSGNPAENLEI